MTKFVTFYPQAASIISAGNTAEEALANAQAALGDATGVEAFPATDRLYEHVTTIGTPYSWTETADGLQDLED